MVLHQERSVFDFKKLREIVHIVQNPMNFNVNGDL